MSDLPIGALALAAAVLFPGPYLWAPVLIFLTNRMSAKPRATRFEAELASLPAAAAEYFAYAKGVLAGDGFEEAGMFFLPNTAPNVEALVLLARNRQSSELALAVAIYATVNGETQLKSTHVEYVSRYRDGRVLGTSNCSVLGCFAKIPGFETAHFPRVQDLHQLYRLHTERCRQAAPTGQRINRLDDEFGGDGSLYLSTVMGEEYARQVPVGYLRLNADSEHYRPTIKGACLMTWKSLWPVKQLRMQERDRRAARLIAVLLPATA